MSYGFDLGPVTQFIEHVADVAQHTRMIVGSCLVEMDEDPFKESSKRQEMIQVAGC